VPTAKITSKGQITIPKKVREKLGVSEGHEVYFQEKNGVFIIQKSVRQSPFEKWIGYLKAKKGRKTDAVIKELRGR